MTGNASDPRIVKLTTIVLLPAILYFSCMHTVQPRASARSSSAMIAHHNTQSHFPPNRLGGFQVRNAHFPRRNNPTT